MRAAITMILGFIAIGLLAITFWPIGVKPFDPSPPGQYPLGQSRFEWPSVERSKAYSPSAAMGTDTVSLGSVLTNPKAKCALSPVCDEKPITL
jgi:hypothetical protein